MELQSKTKLELIFENLDLAEVAKSIDSDSNKGPTGYNPEAILRAFLAQQIENISTRAGLAQRLKDDPVFRFSCGFEIFGKTPSEATLCRYYNKLTESDSLEKIIL